MEHQNKCSTIIQRFERGRQVRKRISLQIRAATHIQSCFRMFIAKKMRLKLLHAVVLIQTQIRVCVYRKRFLRIRNGIVKIQSLVRSYWLCKKYNKAISGFIRIQAIHRGRLERKRFHKCKIGFTQFQAVFRGLMARQLYKKRCLELEAQKEREMQAAIKIQKIYRGYTAKKTFDLLLERFRIEEEQEVRKQSAITIQKLYRGWKDRCFFFELVETAKSQNEQKNRSAIIIQRSFKSYKRNKVALQSANTKDQTNIETCVDSSNSNADLVSQVVRDDRGELSENTGETFETFEQTHQTNDHEKASNMEEMNIPTAHRLQEESSLVSIGNMENGRVKHLPPIKSAVRFSKEIDEENTKQDLLSHSSIISGDDFEKKDTKDLDQISDDSNQRSSGPSILQSYVERKEVSQNEEKPDKIEEVDENKEEVGQNEEKVDENEEKVDENKEEVGQNEESGTLGSIPPKNESNKTIEINAQTEMELDEWKPDMINLEKLVGCEVQVCFETDEGNEDWFTGVVNSATANSRIVGIQFEDGDEQEVDIDTTEIKFLGPPK